MFTYIYIYEKELNVKCLTWRNIRRFELSDVRNPSATTFWLLVSNIRHTHKMNKYTMYIEVKKRKKGKKKAKKTGAENEKKIQRRQIAKITKIWSHYTATGVTLFSSLCACFFPVLFTTTSVESKSECNLDTTFRCAKEFVSIKFSGRSSSQSCLVSDN